MGSGSIFLGGSLEAAAYQSLAYDTPLMPWDWFFIFWSIQFSLLSFLLFTRGVAVAVATIYSAYAEQTSLSHREPHFSYLRTSSLPIRVNHLFESIRSDSWCRVSISFSRVNRDGVCFEETFAFIAIKYIIHTFQAPPLCPIPLLHHQRGIVS